MVTYAITAGYRYNIQSLLWLICIACVFPQSIDFILLEALDTVAIIAR